MIVKLIVMIYINIIDLISRINIDNINIIDSLSIDNNIISIISIHVLYHIDIILRYNIILMILWLSIRLSIKSIIMIYINIIDLISRTINIDDINIIDLLSIDNNIISMISIHVSYDIDIVSRYNIILMILWSLIWPSIKLIITIYVNIIDLISRTINIDDINIIDLLSIDINPCIISYQYSIKIQHKMILWLSIWYDCRSNWSLTLKNKKHNWTTSNYYGENLWMMQQYQFVKLQNLKVTEDLAISYLKVTSN